MLFVRFQLGGDAYAVAARQVLEILPALPLKHLPCAPPGTAGLLNYRGSSLPVIDLSLMALGQPCPPRLSTRILVIRLPDWDDKTFGLLVEGVSSVFAAAPEQFQASGMSLEQAPFLGPVLSDQGRLVQWIQPEQVLSPAVRQALFA
jgi:chemotaxis-related protein WspB